jgi:hypothetical protein
VVVHSSGGSSSNAKKSYQVQELANDDQIPLTTIQKVCPQYLVKLHFQGFFLWLKICNNNKIMLKVTADNDDDNKNSLYRKSFIIRERHAYSKLKILV